MDFFEFHSQWQLNEQRAVFTFNSPRLMFPTLLITPGEIDKNKI